MNSKIIEAAKDIQDYFCMELNEYDRNKLISILQRIPQVQVVTKTVTVTEEKKDYKKLDLDAYLREACEIYGANFEDCFKNNSKAETVSARTHFCRHVRMENKSITCTKLAEYLKKNHTTILNMWYWSKAICELPPLKINT